LLSFFFFFKKDNKSYLVVFKMYQELKTLFAKTPANVIASLADPVNRAKIVVRCGWELSIVSISFLILVPKSEVSTRRQTAAIGEKITSKVC
jgi:hypothetical protein